MRRAVVVLSVLVGITLLGLSAANAAEELWIIKDGVLAKKFVGVQSKADFKAAIDEVLG